MRLLAALPLLRRLPARLGGVGVRPEHVARPEARAPIGPDERVPSSARVEDPTGLMQCRL